MNDQEPKREDIWYSTNIFSVVLVRIPLAPHVIQMVSLGILLRQVNILMRQNISLSL